MSITANKEKAYNELLCFSEVSSQDIDDNPPLDDSIHSATSHDSFYQLSLGSPVQKYDDTLTTIDVVKIGRRKDRPCSALTIPNVDEINESVEEEAFSTDKPKDFTLRQSPVKKEEDNTLNLSSLRCSFFKSIGDVQDEEGEPNEESKWVEFNEFEISTETTENSVYTSEVGGTTSTAFSPIIFATAEVKSTQTTTMIQSDDGSTKHIDNDSLVQQVDELRIRLEALEQLVDAGGIGGGENPTQVSSDSASSEDLDTAFLNEDSADTLTVTETFTITNDVEENYVSSSNNKRGKVSAFKRMFRLFAK